MANPTAGVPVATTPYSAADRAYFEPSSTAQTFRQGEMIGINAAGYATKLDDTASLMFAGIRDATVDLVVASGGSNGDYPDIPVETPRYFQMKIASAAVTDKGRPVFALYSNEVSFNAGSYKNYVGIVRDVISSTVVEVEAAYLTPKVVITYRYNAPADSTLFVAEKAYRVIDVRLRPDVVGSDGSAVTADVKIAASGTAIASGTSVLAATTSFDLKGTAHTNQTNALHATSANLDLPAGSAIGMDVTGVTTAATGLLQITLVPCAI